MFIDGGYVDALGRRLFRSGADYERLAEQVTADVKDATAEPVDLLRAFYYSAPPYQSNPPTDEERERYAGFRRFQDALTSIPRFEVRLGRLQQQGTRPDGTPIFGQKQVDLLLGLDIALLSGKQQITHAALIAGDGDLVPAVGLAKREGVSVWLFHGPSVASDNQTSTYSRELWQAVDDRREIDQAFWDRVRRL